MRRPAGSAAFVERRETPPPRELRFSRRIESPVAEAPPRFRARGWTAARTDTVWTRGVGRLPASSPAMNRAGGAATAVQSNTIPPDDRPRMRGFRSVPRPPPASRGACGSALPCLPRNHDAEAGTTCTSIRHTHPARRTGSPGRTSDPRSVDGRPALDDHPGIECVRSLRSYAPNVQRKGTRSLSESCCPEERQALSHWMRERGSTMESPTRITAPRPVGVGTAPRLPVPWSHISLRRAPSPRRSHV